MSTDGKRVCDYLERIRVRVDSWARGGEYGPGGFSKDTAEHDVTFLLHRIADLEEEIDSLGGASAPRTVGSDGSDLPAGTVVLDSANDARQRWRGEEGEEPVAVPHDTPARLRDEFQGAATSERRLSALSGATQYLRPSVPAPVGQAVASVEGPLSGQPALLDISSEDYLARLMEALATYHGVGDQGGQQEIQALSAITSLCVRWVAEISSAGRPFSGGGASEVLAEVWARAESGPAVGGFPTMAALAGTAAKWIDEARESEEGRRRLAEGLTGPVLALARCSLARMAQSLGREGL